MSLAYRVLYGIGFTPWEHLAAFPAVTEQISTLIDREEHERRPPYGPALDLGCGSGAWTVALAQRGWSVTGVDIVPKALRRARQRAERAGVEIRLVRGDATSLTATGVGDGFSFLLDFGLFHDELTDEQRAALGREVTAVAPSGATLLMMAWRPRRRRGALWRGASQAETSARTPRGR
jgi:SAM-dependent methyltransferase